MMNTKKLITLIIALTTLLAAQAQICFRVEGNGLKSPSYLYGTHHLAPLSSFGDYEGARKAFAESECVVGEIDLSEASTMGAVMQMQQYMVAPADSTLTELLGNRFESYAKKFEAIVPTMKLEMLNQMKPMVASALIAVTLISQNLDGYTPGEQLDAWFQEQGKIEEKEIKHLETPEQQAAMLYGSTSVAVQLEGLTKALDNPQELVDNARKMNSAYLRHDLEALQLLTDEEETPEGKAFMDTLLRKRNANWIELLPKMMNEKGCFIAVGALHLAGPEGLPAQLRKLGYEVTPL